MSMSWTRKTRNLIPPVRRTFLPRPRLMTTFVDILDYPLTLVKAGAGYGKTTALSAFAHETTHATRWLTITEEHRDLSMFVSALLGLLLPLGEEVLEEEAPEQAVIKGVARVKEGTGKEATAEDDVAEHHLEDQVARILEAAANPLSTNLSAIWAAELMNEVIRDDVMLFLDDFHVCDDEPIVLEWLNTWLRKRPTEIHVVIGSRTEPPLSYYDEMQLRGHVLVIRERDLVFTEYEITHLFWAGTQSDVHQLTPEQVKWLYDRTGGMAMVLATLWREWIHSHSFARLESLMSTRASVTEQVGRLVCEQLPQDLLSFFRQTCILTALSPDICDALLARTDSLRTLTEAERKGWLVAMEDGSYCLHPLVRDYLQATLTQEERSGGLLRIMSWFDAQGQTHRAVSYLFALPDERQIGHELLRYIPHYLSIGEVSTVSGWLDRVSPTVITASPDLLFAKGEVARHKNDFADALVLYEDAHQLAAEKGDVSLANKIRFARIRLYLDTIQPRFSNISIREARRHVERSSKRERYELLQLAYESAINEGRLVRAARLQGVLMRPNGPNIPTNNSDARLCLRTGQIHRAIELVRKRIPEGYEGQRPALSHREATLLLSLLLCMTGDTVQAKEQALRGAAVGELLSAPFVRAVGYIRLGHALQLRDVQLDEALEAYQTAIRLMEEMNIQRGKAEALLGVCLVLGHKGQWQAGQSYAEEGISIAEAAGDVWMANLVRIGYAKACFMNGEYDTALLYLSEAIVQFKRCGDQFLYTISLLWRALVCHMKQDNRRFEDVRAAISSAESLHCEFIFLRPTLFGLRDVHSVIPLLQDYALHTDDEQAIRYLALLGYTPLDAHPGYAIRVQTLGTFRVWRGPVELTPKDWQRSKSRQLFQYLLAHKGRPVHREEVCEQLWGDVGPESAERDFKVALNALSAALEPNRRGRRTTTFIQRTGSQYQLTRLPILEIDSDTFVQMVKASKEQRSRTERMRMVRAALELYGGEYLEECRYEAWAMSSRQKLKDLFVEASLQFAKDALAEKLYVDVVATCEQLVQYEPAVEEAYVLMMMGYGELRQRHRVIGAYQRCQQALQVDLGIDLMDTTTHTYLQYVSPSSTDRVS